jgi:bile acid-coenzyme A ligase
VSDLSGKPIIELLRELAAAAPDRIAVTAEEGILTRGELDAESDLWAGEFIQLGVGVGDYVCLVLPNGLEFVSVLLGVWKAGAVPVPLNDRLAAAELVALVDLIGPSAVVGGDGAVLGSRPRLPSGRRPAPHRGIVLDRAVISPSWKAMASGGSTGRPKVIVSTDPATVTEDLTGNDASAGGNETTLITAPLPHNGPFYNLVRTLLLGGRAVLAGRFDPERLLAAIERERATRVYLVPTMMSRIWKLPEEVRRSYDLSSLRTVIHMGAPCPAWLKRAWIDWLGPDRLTELYSTTEGVVVFTATGREWLEHPGTVGLPHGGEVQIRSADGVPLPPGATGLIWARRDPGLGPSYRYLGATASAGCSGWETVGDIGRVDEDGYLYIEDREADMILVGGSNVYPAEVEAVVLEHPAVFDCCVIGLPDDDLGQVPHAIVYATAPADQAGLAEYAAQRLTAYKRPRSWEFVSSPLRDAAGKVRRRQLITERLPPPRSGTREPDPKRIEPGREEIPAQREK